MKNTLIVLFLIASGLTGYSQDITLVPAGQANNKKLIEGVSFQSALSGSMGYTVFDYMPLKNGGFIRRNDLTFQCFGPDMKLIWEKTLPKTFGLQQLPEEFTTYNKEFLYFLEVGTNNKINLTRFSLLDGSIKVASAETNSKVYFGGGKDFYLKTFSVRGIFTSTEGFHYVIVKQDTKAKKDEYLLGSFKGASLEHSIIPISLPADEGDKYYSYEYISSIDKAIPMWRANDIFYSAENGIRLIKYFALNNKKASYVTSESLFLNYNGTVSNHIKTKFTPASEYLNVQSLFNEVTNELITFSARADNNLELSKVDITGATKLTKKIPLTEVSKLIPFKSAYQDNFKKRNSSSTSGAYLKQFENIFYDAVNESYVLVEFKNPHFSQVTIKNSNQWFCTHLTSDFKIVRIDVATWVATLGMTTGLTEGSTNIVQKEYQLEWDRYNGSSKVLMCSFYDLKNAFIDKSIPYNHKVYDVMLKSAENPNWKEFMYTLINLEGKKQVLVVENATKLSVEGLTNK